MLLVMSASTCICPSGQHRGWVGYWVLGGAVGKKPSWGESADRLRHDGLIRLSGSSSIDGVLSNPSCCATSALQAHEHCTQRLKGPFSSCTFPKARSLKPRPGSSAPGGYALTPKLLFVSDLCCPLLYTLQPDLSCTPHIVLTAATPLTSCPF